jgi:hypothetical protein
MILTVKCVFFRGVKYYTKMEAAFTCEVGGELQSTSATVYSPTETLSEPADFNVDELISHCDDVIDSFNSRRE